MMTMKHSLGTAARTRLSLPQRLRSIWPGGPDAQPLNALAVHAVLLGYTLLALSAILLVIMNSFKARRSIFNDPLALPTIDSVSLVGYQRVLERSDFGLYFGNSI